MLKKIYTGALALLIGLLSIGFFAPAASASEVTSKVTYCQATASTTNPFNKITAAKDSVLHKDGTLKQGGINANDIVPPFEYNFGGNDYGSFAGQNWTTQNQTLWRNDCNPASTVLTPVLPVAPIQTCANPNPTFVVPAQPEGINVTSAADDKGNYTVSYELPANTVYNTYSFVTGFVNNVLISTIDNRPLDDMWDAAKGACNMPDTGAGKIKSEHILIGGGLIFTGLVLTALTRRRKA
jgi:hypothetical protein